MKAAETSALALPSLGALPFTGPALLAPMEGVTESSFRDLVLRRNPASQLGGAFTEFVRVSRVPLSKRSLRRHLGPERHAAPVGLQLMGSDPDCVAESARRAMQVGAPLVDLNFGCPAKGALRGCAGSALLDQPERIEALVAACAAALEGHPLSAKVRAGGEDDSRLEEICLAAEAGGAQLLSVHCRTRREGYRDTADWGRLSRAVEAVSIPVAGNGGIESFEDVERLLSETGCRYAMIGRAALADPWIFSGYPASQSEAARFLLEYAQLLQERHAAPALKVNGRLKQLMRHWRVAGLFDTDRSAWLSQPDPQALLAHLGTRLAPS